MNIETFKMIIAIVQTGTFSGAGEQLGYAQSNISARVHQLEDSLQTPIFYRTNRGVVLTSAGQSFYQRAIRIVDLTEDTIHFMKSPDIVNGDLRIGTLQPASTTYLPSILTKYHQAFPKVKLTIETGNTNENLERVLDYRLSGAVIGGEVDDPALCKIPLATEELCLISANDERPDLKTASLLVFPQGCVYRKTLETWLSYRRVTVQRPIEFNYLNAILASVSAGLGISVVPKAVAQPFVDSHAMSMTSLPKQFATIPLSFIYRKDHVIDRAFGEFTKILTNTESSR